MTARITLGFIINYQTLGYTKTSLINRFVWSKNVSSVGFKYKKKSIQVES